MSKLKQSKKMKFKKNYWISIMFMIFNLLMMKFTLEVKMDLYSF